jgi:histidyl-tRNA synthetase
VLVTIRDGERLRDAGALLAELRGAGVRAEIFTGTGLGFGKQVKYADRAGIPVVVIAGADEFARGAVTVKQMKEPSFESDASREAWLAARLGQQEVPRAGLVAAVKRALESAGR